jgi:hypothetical protein
LGPSVKSLDRILEYGIVPPLPHPPVPTSPVLLSQASNTTTTPQPSRTAGEVPPCTTPPPCPPTLPTVQSLPITEESLKFDNDQSRKHFEQEFRDYGGGGKYPVAKFFYRGEQKAEDLEEEDVEICLQLTLLVQSLSLRQYKLLGNFLDLLFQKIDRIQDLNFKKICTTPSEKHAQIAHVQHASNIQRQPKKGTVLIYHLFLLSLQPMAKYVWSF